MILTDPKHSLIPGTLMKMCVEALGEVFAHRFNGLTGVLKY